AGIDAKGVRAQHAYDKASAGYRPQIIFRMTGTPCAGAIHRDRNRMQMAEQELAHLHLIENDGLILRWKALRKLLVNRFQDDLRSWRVDRSKTLLESFGPARQRAIGIDDVRDDEEQHFLIAPGQVETADPKVTM